jgi:1-acyl-sn-glycerol-3-phosphate acyltransferase
MILVINHLSRIDPALVAVVVSRTDLTALVGDTYKKNLPIRWVVNAMGGIWIRREQSDLVALRQALDFLAGGGLLGIAPEGTRSRVGSMIPAKTGAAYLADKSGVPLIPVAITGSEVAFSELFKFRRPIITLQFGKPFSLPPIKSSGPDRHQARQARLQSNTDEIMCRIAVMLPDKYWGVYRDHPRLLELLGNLSKT